MNLIETSDGYGDLVQRLRGRSAFLRNKHGRVKSPEVMEEAATEIERLTAQVETMREALGWYADTFCEYGTSNEGCGKFGDDMCAGCKARALSYRGGY